MSFLKLKRLTCSVVLMLTVGLYQCSKKEDPVPPDEDALNREAMLTNIADNIVIPSYGKFKIKLDAMTAKSNAFTSSPTTTTLSEFRTAWVEAYTEWERVELFDFGPGQTEAIRAYFNIYPASEGGIAANIVAGSSVNLDVASSYPTQGFPALDYLLNGLASTDVAIVSLYTSDANASKRIDYIKLLVAKMNSVFTKVNTDWATYRNQFVTKTGMDAGSSTSLMVNAYVLNYERYIRSGKFGIPSGAMANSGGTKYPDRVEAYYKKDISLALAKAAHQASVDFFNGKNVTTGVNGSSLKTYLDALDAKDAGTGTLLSSIINTQFDAANTKLNLLSANLYQEVLSNNQAMINVYAEMQKAVRMLKVDMTSAISITITYTDNDGD